MWCFENYGVASAVFSLEMKVMQAGILLFYICEFSTNRIRSDDVESLDDDRLWIVHLDCIMSQR